jgi:hypothetical protein
VDQKTPVVAGNERGGEEKWKSSVCNRNTLKPKEKRETAINREVEKEENERSWRQSEPPENEEEKEGAKKEKMSVPRAT